MVASFIRIRTSTLLLALSLALAGCASQSAGPGAGEEDLRPVDDKVFGRAWVNPDADLSGYTKIMFRGGGVTYADINSADRTTSLRRSGAKLTASDEEKARFERLFADAFSDRFRDLKGYELVAVGEPGVLIVLTALGNVQLKAQDDRLGNIERLEYSGRGSAGLVVELYDGEDETLLARYVDVRAAELNESNQVQIARANTNWSAWERLARQWAEDVAQRLESLAAAGGA